MSPQIPKVSLELEGIFRQKHGGNMRWTREGVVYVRNVLDLEKRGKCCKNLSFGKCLRIESIKQ